jgi:hypothetical protein
MLKTQYGSREFFDCVPEIMGCRELPPVRERETWDGIHGGDRRATFLRTLDNQFNGEELVRFRFQVVCHVY